MIWTAALAFVSMMIADILSVLLVQAEARNKANLSGILDTLGWVAGMVVTFTTVTALGGHDFTLKVLVVVAVSIANYVGSVIGTNIGKRFVPDATTLAERVARLEALSTQIHD